MQLPRMDRDDKAWLAGTIIGPIIVWWIFYGRRKYGVKGMN